MRGFQQTRWAPDARAAGSAWNPAGVVYGVTAVGVLLAAESGSHETYLDTVASVVIATALYWLSRAYAEALGRRLQGGENLTMAALLDALVDEWTIVCGGAIPLAALLVAGAAGAAQETAVTAGLWSTIGAIVAFEALAAFRSRASPREFAIELAVGVTLGSAILGLRIILH